MKGKIFKNQWNKLSLRGEDGEFYMIGKSLEQYGDGAEIEFDITETTYNGKQQKWANAVKSNEEKPGAQSSGTNKNTSDSSGDLMTTLIRGVAAIVKEQRETNRLLGELIKKGGQGTNPIQPKPAAEEPKKNQLGDLPF